MTRILKSDFHLHTHHSDNRDRMTPAEYVQLARRSGYAVLGFCDHHHNLTQRTWTAQQAEVAAEMAHLAADELLLTTGYEATWMTGHLCVLGKQEFDGESIVACDQQMWSPANTRILAHPDNNICAWRLPLPVDIQGVEVINGGQDPYSVYVGSPCNGLPTFQRYLLLNHPVAVIAQSDCHQRAVFGRAWTGVMVANGAPLIWDTVQDALRRGHTFAAMGDLPIRVWAEDGSLPGDHVEDGAVKTLLWEVPVGAEVTVYMVDRPVAHFVATSTPATASSRGYYTLRHNGPHWLLVKRGLAWAVSTPFWVSNQAMTSAPLRAALAQHGTVQKAADTLRRRLEWLAALDAGAAPGGYPVPYPVARYVAWLGAQLPSAWSESDPAFSGPGDVVDWAMARLNTAHATLAPILHDLARARYHTGEGSVVVTAHHAPLAAGVYRATVDLPAQVALPVLATMTGDTLPTLATTIVGERDPLHGPRSRVQMHELIAWLERGEIHEYQFVNCELACAEGTLRLVADLWPAVLGGMSHARPDLAHQLAAAIADPAVEHFFVHLRMPRRFALIFALDEAVASDHLLLEVVDGRQVDGGKVDGGQTAAAAIEERTIHFMADGALVSDPSELSLVVQLTGPRAAL